MKNAGASLVVLCLLVGLGACTPQPTTPTAVVTEPSAAGTPDPSRPPSAGGDTQAPVVTQQGDELVITGKGNATTAPIVLTEKFYIARVEITSDAPESFMMYEGDRELPAVMATKTGTSVFRVVKGGSTALKIETGARYELTLSPPSSLGAPVSTPQNWSGAEGELVTPAVNVPDNAELSVTYKGKQSDNAAAMTVLVLVYDAEDGLEAAPATYVNGAKPTEKVVVPKGKRFAIITCSTADSWEVTLA